VLVSHALGDLLVGAGVLLLISVVGLGLGWRPHGSPFAIAAGFLLVAGFVFGMTWVGITLGATVRNPESIESIGALGLVLLTFVSDAVFPAADMPVWLRPVIDWSPVSAVADAVWSTRLSGSACSCHRVGLDGGALPGRGDTGWAAVPGNGSLKPPHPQARGGTETLAEAHRGGTFLI
jgi:hypothetical protein